MNYLKLALVVLIGIAAYYASLVVYSPGTANIVGLIYVLLSIRVYQALDMVWPRSSGVAA